MIAVFYAHPYPRRSRANRRLFDAIATLGGVERRSLYDLYPDFSIDIEAEQAALVAADVVVWQHPIYWYTAPALQKLWFEKVLALGWAFGRGGDMLRGKRCLWVATTGAPEDAYDEAGMHQHAFGAFEPVVRQTAQFCGMKWLEPMIVHGAIRLSDDELEAQGQKYRARLIELGATEVQRA
ncbi:MAG: glutathione-regulated potassium-efflux system oxidoreductase KefF [Myxococcales bacterium]|nr:glutathione-regulated potassium-efflux system oxidoreductase KefF [Myxococcales bacterium]